MNSKLKTFLPPVLLLIVVFGSAMILFLELQPFVLFDTDDWQYISIQRKMIPMPGSWNPTRVFPEIFMPFCSNVAAYVIMPFTGDYLEALKVEYALVYSSSIVVYIGLFYALVRKRFAASVSTAVFTAALFYLFHFIVIGGGTHLFQTSSVTNLFYYALPNLLCCSIVLFLMKDDVLDGFFSDRHVVKKGIFLAVLYLALISNIFASIVIAAYIGIDLLLRLIKTLREKKPIAAFFTRSIPKLIVLVFWALVQVLEATGGRAHSMKEAGSFSDGIIASVSRFLGLDFDMLFIALAGFIVIAFFVMVFRHRAESFVDPRMRLIGVTALAGVLMLAYLILLCARAGAGYIQRADVIASFFFFAITVVALCLVMLMNRYPRVVFVVPVFILFVAFYIHPVVNSATVELKTSITNEIIDQVQEGAAAGDETVEVHVPAYTTKDNWPIADYAAWAFSRSLYQHGVIDRLVTIEMIPDTALNEKFGIPIPDNVENTETNKDMAAAAQ